jgi:hypothetical protein
MTQVAASRLIPIKGGPPVASSFFVVLRWSRASSILYSPQLATYNFCDIILNMEGAVLRVDVTSLVLGMASLRQNATGSVQPKPVHNQVVITKRGGVAQVARATVS